MARCCWKNETAQFSLVEGDNFSAGALILPARPERTALLLSVDGFAGTPTYVLGNSPIDGIVIRPSLNSPTIKLLASELGSVVGLQLFNGGNALLRVALSETWEVPTGRRVRDYGE